MILILKCLLNNYVENNLNKPKKLFHDETKLVSIRGLAMLSFSISVLILIYTKIWLFAFWATLKHFFFTIFHHI